MFRTVNRHGAKNTVLRNKLQMMDTQKIVILMSEKKKKTTVKYVRHYNKMN